MLQCLCAAESSKADFSGRVLHRKAFDILVMLRMPALYQQRMAPTRWLACGDLQFHQQTHSQRRCMPLCSRCDSPAASNAYEMQAAFLSMYSYSKRPHLCCLRLMPCACFAACVVILHITALRRTAPRLWAPESRSSNIGTYPEVAITGCPAPHLGIAGLYPRCIC